MKENLEEQCVFKHTVYQYFQNTILAYIIKYTSISVILGLSLRAEDDVFFFSNSQDRTNKIERRQIVNSLSENKVLSVRPNVFQRRRPFDHLKLLNYDNCLISV